MRLERRTVTNEEFLRGLTILLSYLEPGRRDIEVDPEQVFVGPDNMHVPDFAEAELRVLGWHRSPEYRQGVWTCNVVSQED